MVEYILGNYLVETGKITKEQLKTAMKEQDSTRVKLFDCSRRRNDDTESGRGSKQNAGCYG